MAPKELETTTVELSAGRYGLRASATRTLFEGFAKVYTEGRDDGADDEAEGQLPPLREGEWTSVVEVTPTQHFTEPPPRYTEATLIKALEEHGIGRPSTYAATISTIVDRGYVTIRERRLHPELVGEIVTDLLVEHFGEFVDLEFTARMEEELDEVALGNREWVPLLREFYGPFKALVDEKRTELRRRDFTTEETDEVCSLGHPMVIRLGRNGRFLACSTYPEHKETRPLPGEEPEPVSVPGVGQDVPEVRRGHPRGETRTVRRVRGLLPLSRLRLHPPGRPAAPASAAVRRGVPAVRRGPPRDEARRRTGTEFWGCSRYPKCRFTTSREPVGATHDADAGPVVRNGDVGMCLRCGAAIDLPEVVVPGTSLAGRSAGSGSLAPRRRGGARGAAGTVTADDGPGGVGEGEGSAGDGTRVGSGRRTGGSRGSTPPARRTGTTRTRRTKAGTA